MVSISKSSSPLFQPLETVLKALTTIGIRTTFMLHNFLVLWQGLNTCLTFRFLWFLLSSQPGWQSPQFDWFSLFFFKFLFVFFCFFCSSWLSLGLVFLPGLGDPSLSQNPREFYYYYYGDTDYFDIVAGVMQGDTLAPYLFIICLDNVLRTSKELRKENGFTLAKKRSRRYPAQTITDADYVNDIALLANTPTQTESLLHSRERAIGDIGLHVNANKTEYIKEATFPH